MRRVVILIVVMLAACGLAAACGSSARTAPAVAPQAPDAATTTAVAAMLAEFDSHCHRVGERTWPVTLCGPVVLVEPRTRLAFANRPDPQRRFVHTSGVYTGTLTGDDPLANTAVDWHGQRWAMMMLPAPADTFNRLRLLAHESFHRIQPKIGILLSTPVNAHLDERDARLWLRLELRALAAAATLFDREARDALADALLFRAKRHRLYPGSDTLEAQLELGEGTAEYAGVRFAMDALGRTPTAVLAWSRARFERTPTFTRSLGYGSGPPLGLALDRFAPEWRDRIGTIRSMSGELATAIGWTVPQDLERLALERAVAYDLDPIAVEEDARAVDRAKRLAEYRANLIDGPVVLFRQQSLGGSFNPNMVVPMGAAGTVYPSRRFVAEWGTLEVTEGGALVSPDGTELRVRAPEGLRTGATNLVRGPGWELKLTFGWSVEPGVRAGDWEVRRASELDPETRPVGSRSVPATSR